MVSGDFGSTVSAPAQGQSRAKRIEAALAAYAGEGIRSFRGAVVWAFLGRRSTSGFGPLRINKHRFQDQHEIAWLGRCRAIALRSVITLAFAQCETMASGLLSAIAMAHRMLDRFTRNPPEQGGLTSTVPLGRSASPKKLPAINDRDRVCFPRRGRGRRSCVHPSRESTSVWLGRAPMRERVHAEGVNRSLSRRHVQTTWSASRTRPRR